MRWSNTRLSSVFVFTQFSLRNRFQDVVLISWHFSRWLKSAISSSHWFLRLGTKNMKQCDSGSDVIFAFLLRKKERLIKNCWSRAFVSLSLIDSWWLITVLLTAAVLLLFQYSELELALNTLVTEFHKAADNGPTMNTTQFQSMISSQMPAIAKVLMTSQLVFQSQII